MTAGIASPEKDGQFAPEKKEIKLCFCLCTFCKRRRILNQLRRMELP